MKKISIALFILALSISSSSCQKEEQINESSSQSGEIIKSFSAEIKDAHIDEEFTKAAVDVSDGKVTWEENDQIMVSNGSTSAVFTYDSDLKAFFSKSGIEATGTYSAVYPASAVKSVSGLTFNVDLPAIQEYDANYVKNAPMSAYSTTNVLTFKNVCTILKLQLNGDHNISSIVFTANGKSVAGAAVVNPETSTLTMSTTDQNVLMLNTSSSVQLGTATPFYIVVPAQLYSNGFSIKANTTLSWLAFDKSTTKAVNLSAGHISAMKAFDAMLFSGGLGTEENPYKIAKEQDLIDLSTYSNSDDDFANFVDKHYLQTQNITITAANFAPISALSSHSFSGTFDGNHKYIYNLNINYPEKDNIGLFGCVKGAVLKNIHPAGNGADATITGNANVGVIAGRFEGGIISGCGFGRMAVSGGNKSGDIGNGYGIVAGYVPGPNATISDCSVGASCSVGGKGMHAGGIAGRMNSTCKIENCEVKSCIIGCKQGMGGVLGYMEGNAVVNSCFSSAKINGNSGSSIGQAGGVVGYIVQTKVAGEVSTVINCIYGRYVDNTGGTITVSSSGANGYVGGIVGGTASATGGLSTVDIVNCYSYPYQIKNSNSAGIGGFGGILGGANFAGVRIFNCYSPMIFSTFYLGGKAMNVSNYSNYSEIGSIAGHLGVAGVTIDRVYARQTLRLFLTEKGATASNLSSSVADPAMKNYDRVVYHTSFTKEVDNYPSFKEALDRGVDVYNSTNPSFRAVYWTADTAYDGYLKPDGVYKAPAKPYKKVSIIGDAISTYRSYIFEDQSVGYNPYYPNSWKDGETTVYGDVLSERNTWWWKLIYNKMSSARVEVVNSYSGSSVCYIDKNTPNFGNHNVTDGASTTYCFVERYRNDKEHPVGNPDIVLIYGGRNDNCKYGGSTNDYLGSLTTAQMQEAYVKGRDVGSGVSYRNYTVAMSYLVGLLRRDFPNVKILLISHDMITDGYANANTNIVKALTAIDSSLKLKAVSFHSSGMTPSSGNTNMPKDHGSSCHPNNTATTYMANYIYEQVGSWLDE